VSALGDDRNSFAFGVDQKYVAVERDSAQFLAVIEDFINVLEAELPDPGSECTTCIYLSTRNALDNL
jgi:hypothetical protein